MKKMFPVCYDEYSERSEDTTPYNKPGWIAVDNFTKKDELYRLCPKPWRYQESSRTYAGGFVADLGYENQTSLGIIETLQRHNWLDLQSRFVVLELSAFNPPTNLLAVATYVYEIRPSGYSALSEKIHIISLDSSETGSRQFYLMCVLIFIIFVLLYTGRLCYRVYKLRLRFFKSFWNWVEIFQVTFSALAVVMTIIRSAKVVWPVRKLKDNIYANVGFRDVIPWKEAEDGVLGLLAFVITLKFLRLFRFNTYVAVLSRTMRESARLLPSFILIFAIFFTAFLLFGMLIFGAESEKYPSFLQASLFQFELVLGKVKSRDIQDLSEVNRTFGRPFTVCLLFGVTIMFMNFFIAALNDAISKAQTFVLQNELYDLIDENFSRNGKNEKFFDAISRCLKQITVKGTKSVCERGKRQQQQQKKIKNGYLSLTTVCDDDVQLSGIQCAENTTKRQLKKLLETVSAEDVQLSGLQCAEDTTKLQMKKLLEKERELLRRLGGVIQAYSEEEEEFLSLALKSRLDANNTAL